MATNNNLMVIRQIARKFDLSEMYVHQLCTKKADEIGAEKIDNKWHIDAEVFGAWNEKRQAGGGRATADGMVNYIVRATEEQANDLIAKGFTVRKQANANKANAKPTGDASE